MISEANYIVVALTTDFVLGFQIQIIQPVNIVAIADIAEMDSVIAKKAMLKKLLPVSQTQLIVKMTATQNQHLWFLAD